MSNTLILPDSNIFSEIVRPSANRQVVNHYYQNLHRMGVIVSVWHELQYGLYCMPAGRRQALVADFINNEVGVLPLYNYDQNCANIHAKIRARARQRGKTLSYADSQIAAIALANQAILVTRNTQDFQDIDGLVVQNWFLS